MIAESAFVLINPNSFYRDDPKTRRLLEGSLVLAALFSIHISLSAASSRNYIESDRNNTFLSSNFASDEFFRPAYNTLHRTTLPLRHHPMRIRMMPFFDIGFKFTALAKEGK
jgi:hypothetical protein